MHLTKLESWLVTTWIFSHTSKYFPKFLNKSFSRTTSGSFFKSKWKCKYLMGVCKQMRLMKHNTKYSYKLCFVFVLFLFFWLMCQTTTSCFCSVNESKIQFFEYFTQWNEITRRWLMMQQIFHFKKDLPIYQLMHMLRLWSKYD